MANKALGVRKAGFGGVMNKRRLSQSRLVPAVLAACLSCLTALHTAPAIAEDQRTGQILIKNVRIFDGKEARLSSATDVWIVGNKIEQISTTAARTGLSTPGRK